jgi:hypothetical protein
VCIAVPEYAPLTNAPGRSCDCAAHRLAFHFTQSAPEYAWHFTWTLLLLAQI